MEQVSGRTGTPPTVQGYTAGNGTTCQAVFRGLFLPVPMAVIEAESQRFGGTLSQVPMAPLQPVPCWTFQRCGRLQFWRRFAGRATPGGPPSWLLGERDGRHQDLVMSRADARDGGMHEVVRGDASPLDRGAV